MSLDIKSLLVDDHHFTQFLIEFFLLLLKAEGIFRINAENGHEDHLREKLSTGVVPEGVDLHCLAGLIKVISNIAL